MRKNTPSPFSVRFTLCLLAGVLLVGTGMVFLPTSHSKAHTSSIRSAEEMAKPSKAGPAVRADDPVAIIQTTFAASRPASTPVSPEIHAVIPSLLTQIEDWPRYRPASYTLRPTPNSPEITFYLSEFKEEGRFATWIGRSAVPGESFVAVATARGLDAVLTTLGEPPVEIQIRGQRISVRVTDDEIERRGCGSELEQPASLALPDLAVVRSSVDQVASQALVQDANGNLLAGVLYLYDNLALAQANADALDGNGAALMDGTFKARIESANTILANSLINVRWVYLGCFQCPDHGDTPLQDILSILRNSATAVGAFALQKAIEMGATNVQLYTNPTDTQWSGYGDIVGHFGVVRYGAGSSAFTHELGHNYGLNHDRVTCIPSALSPTYDGSYSFGMVFAMSRDAAGNPLEQLGDIMSYSGRRVPYFTNPDIKLGQYVVSATRTYMALSSGNIYLGVLQTTADPTYIYNLPDSANVQPLGIPAGQPYACDGSRKFREMAPYVIGNGWYVAPGIGTQPASTTITQGQGFTLSVGTVGSGTTFTYQWYKGAIAIGGATRSSYSVAGAIDSDSGSYSVTVSASQTAFGNAVTLTSNYAVVTIIPPQSTASSAAASFGPGFAVLLIALFALRSRRV